MRYFNRESKFISRTIIRAIRNVATQVKQLTSRNRLAPKGAAPTVYESPGSSLSDSELAESEERLRLATEFFDVGVWDWDLRSNGVFSSPVLKRQLGFSDFELPNGFDVWEQRLHPDDREKTRATLNDYVAGKIAKYEVEFRMQHRDGSYRWILSRGALMRDATGTPYRMIGAHLDITERKVAEKANLETEQRLRRVLNGLFAFVGVTTPEGVLLEANDAPLRLVGISREDVLGKLFPHTYWWSYCPQVQLRLQSAITCAARGEFVRYDEQVRVADNKLIWIDFAIAPLRDGEGRIVELIPSGVEITDRKRVEDEIRKLNVELEQRVVERTQKIADQARIIDQIHDSVITLDLDGRITSWNRGAEQLFGYSAQEALGHDITLIYLPDDRRFLFDHVLKPLTTKREHDVESRVCDKNGHPFFVHLSLSQLYDVENQPNGIVAYAMDITARRRTEKLLWERTVQLESANQELESFSATVSHDLRTPLRAIHGFSQALLSDYNNVLDETGQDYLKRILAATAHMDSLINDLLRLSRVARMELCVDEVDLTGIVTDIFAGLAQIEPSRKVSLSIQPNLRARGDEQLLRIVMDNLLNNAWKYTSKVTAATIEVGRLSDSNGDVYFVRDNGAGFDMALSSKLFNAFQRLHASTDYPGTGIGLVTVARIVQRHGGAAWAEGNVGKGATFYFSLPNTTWDDAKSILDAADVEGAALTPGAYVERAAHLG